MKDCKYTIVRIDDVGQFNPIKDQIIYNLCKAGVRVTCAVVPAWLTRNCVSFLKYVADEFVDCLEIHQHGYAHNNYGTTRDKYEFGAKRSYDEQLHDILIGRRILEERFEELFFPAFTPPYNAFDDNTLVALRQANFRAISSFADHEPSTIIPEFSPDIDCFHWDPIREKTWNEIIFEWNEVTNKALRGFILHPRLMLLESISLFSCNLPMLLAQSSTVTFSQLLSH